jgi:predicted nucleic acid-binding protein
MERVAARYLVDTSAYARMRIAEVQAILAPLIELGEVATCGMITLEILYSARSPADLEAVRSELRFALTNVPLQDTDFERAIEVMAALAAHGQHRAATLPDLLIAAVAERAGLEPFAAAKLIAGLYTRVLDPLRFATNSPNAVLTREELLERFARILMSSRLLVAVELVSAHIGHLRELDSYQPGLGSAVAHWMQYLASEVLATKVAQSGSAAGSDVARLRTALTAIRDSVTVLDRYKALARRGA